MQKFLVGDTFPFTGTTKNYVAFDLRAGNFMPIAAISKYHRSLRYLALAVSFSGFMSLGHADVVREPLQTGVNFDIGRVQESFFKEAQGLWLQRTGVAFTQGVTVDDRLRLVVTIGGLFFNSFPEPISQSYQRSLKFGPGVGQAQGILKLGELEHPWGRLRFGLIPYKYNPDAKNLGEYLLRSGAYPNVLITGGWSIVNSANMLIQGVDFELHTGPVTHNLLVSMERAYEPTGDFTPAYLFSYKPHPAVELGGGVAFAHLIPIQPSKTSPSPGSGGFPFNRYHGDTVVTDPNDSVYSRYTFEATKLMARASVNFQTLLKSEYLGSEDLKLYAEAAVLGWKDYPFYYSDRWHRIPVMVGFNFPTFRLLDILALEVEYRKADFVNSIAQSYVDRILPLPDLSNYGTNSTQSVTAYDKNALSKVPWYRYQGIKWSVYAKREIIPGLKVYTQIASDHNRPYKFTSDGALVPNREPLTVRPEDWYYLLRLEMGI